MKHIIDEQIRLELGDDYEKALKATRKYISKVIRNADAWGSSSAAQISGEGGMNSMMRNCMLKIIETGNANNIEEGLERYGRELASEYLSGARNKNTVSFNVLLDSTRGHTSDQHLDGQRESLATPLPSSLVSEDSRLEPTDQENEANTSEGDDEEDDDLPLSMVIKTDEELELYEAIAATASLKDAAALIGMDYDYAKKLNKRVWSRARYHVGKRGYRLAQVRS